VWVRFRCYCYLKPLLFCITARRRLSDFESDDDHSPPPVLVERPPRLVPSLLKRGRRRGSFTLMASPDNPTPSSRSDASVSLAALTQALQSLSHPNDVTVSGSLLNAARNEKMLFSGGDIDAGSFDTFLGNYSVLCNTYNASKVARKIVLPNLLKGPAFSFYMSLDESVKNDYDSLCEALRTKFDSKEFAQRCLDRLSTLQQGGDTVALYAQRVRALGRSALGKLSGPVYDTLLMQYFRNGLNSSLQQKLEDLPVTLTFDDAVSMAQRYQYNQMRRQNSEGMLNSAPVNQMVYGVRSANHPRPSGCTFEKRLFPLSTRNSNSSPREPPSSDTNVGRVVETNRHDRPRNRWQGSGGDQSERPLTHMAWCRLCRSRPCVCSTPTNTSASSQPTRSVLQLST
jgi:hypothetical protein